MENEDRIMRFMLRQLVVDSRRNGQHSEDLVHAQELAEEEVAQLKQAMNTQKIQNERIIEDLQRKVQALELLDQEQRNNISVLDTQLHQLSQLQDCDQNSLCKETRRTQRSVNVPPVHGFETMEQSRGRSSTRPSSEPTMSFATPAVGPPYQQHPRSSHSYGSGVQHHTARRSNSPPCSARSAVSNGDNFAAGSGYVFSIRNNNARPRSKSPGAYRRR